MQFFYKPKFQGVEFMQKAKKQGESKTKKREPRLIKTDKTLSEIINELERYNKEHKTHLSYGQYVLLRDY